MTFFQGSPVSTYVVIPLVAGVVGSALLVRSLYRFTRTGGDYKNLGAMLAARGHRILKIITLLTLLCTLLLGFRGNTASPYPLSYWSLSAINESRWAVTRIMVTGVMAANAMVFDAHMVFRWMTVLLLPLLSILDLCSFADFTERIACIERGICAYGAGALNRMTWLAYRDVVGCSMMLICLGVSLSLLVLFGLCSNRLYLPKKEHRVFASHVDRMNIAPKAIQKNNRRMVVYLD